MSTETTTTASDSPPVTGFRAYAQLPREAGWSYLIATSIGRLPLAMVPLVTLTLATIATDSIAVGGFASAAAAVGEALGAPLAGWIADRYGQRPVLLAGVVTHLLSLAAFTLTAGASPDAVTIALAGLTGFTIPQLGAMSRARWLALGPSDLATPFAFEGVIDELVYILGPALVGILSLVASPQVGAGLAGALIGVFVTMFALHRTARLVPGHHGRLAPHRDEDAEDAASPYPAAVMVVLVAITLLGVMLMGWFFGASQTALTEYAEAHGMPGAGALLYAVMGVGSAVATISMVLVPESVSYAVRWMVSAVGMFLGSLLMLSADGLGWLLGALVLAGLFQGPLLLSLFSIAGELSTSRTRSVTMTLVTSSTVAGIALGSALTGMAAGAGGEHGALLMVTLGTAILIVLGLAFSAIRAVMRRHAA